MMIMDRCLFQLLLLISSQVLTVAGTNSVLSTSDVTENEPFTMYCDAYKAGDPNPVDSVADLTLYRRITIATYYSMFAILRGQRLEGRNFTLARETPNWTYTFRGYQFPDRGKKEHMNIEVVVNTAQCNDSGTYYCEMNYWPTRIGTLQSVQSTPEALKVWSPPGDFKLTYQPQPTRVNKEDSSHLMYESGTSVSLNCSCKGPKGLVITWEMLVEDTWNNRYSSNPLPEPPSNADPALVFSPAGCLQYLYLSTLTVQVQANKASIFKCSVRNETGQVYTKSLKLSTPEEVSVEVIEVTTEASSTPKRCPDPAILLMVSIVCLLGSWY